MQLYYTQTELFESRSYPAGEGHSILKLVPESKSIVIEAQARNFNDLHTIRVQNDILVRNGIHARWFIPYFPYARQDRRETKLSGQELLFALEIVRGMDVVIADPHSDVSGTLPHFTQESVYKCFNYYEKLGDKVVIIPDGGAAKKAYGWATGDKREIVQCLKVRDPKTGKLSGFDVIADIKHFSADGMDIPSGNLVGASIIILDDICDGGGTFLGLGEILKRDFYVKDMTLAITHGLFTQGTEKLKTMFDQIITFVPSDNWRGTNQNPNQVNPGVFEISYEVLYSMYNEEIL